MLLLGHAIRVMIFCGVVVNALASKARYRVLVSTPSQGSQVKGFFFARIAFAASDASVRCLYRLFTD